ncbi:MATE family efflux transporter [Zooshikella ganghwensis]|uniref:MATE family efflux transporter n=1 Tax=Zooshikella ganghwensis TaxID=202772 RepID=UPI000400352D|nr:MATE family efflux transporter [Zooshikella ganghwensis]
MSKGILQEARHILHLAYPIIITQLAASGMGLTDTIMAGQLGALDLAAIAIGAGVWVPLYLFAKGTYMALTPTVAHLFGAKRNDDIGTYGQQGLWIGLVCGLLLAVLLANIKPLLHWLDVDPDIIPLSSQYLTALAFGMPALSLFNVFTSYCEGVGKTKPGMTFMLIGLMLNIPANYIFMYGKFGFPAMGAVGCGWATATVAATMMVLIAIYTHLAPSLKHFGLFRHWSLPRLGMIKELLALGLPMGISIFAEASIFSIVSLLLGRLGAEIVASHQIAINISSIAFMVPFSIAMAVTIRIGHWLGGQQPVNAKKAGQLGIMLALGYAVFSASCMLAFPHFLAEVYTSDSTVIELTVGLLWYAAVFQFSDGLQVAANGILRGYKDTKIPMMVVIIAYWGIGLPIGYLFGLTDFITPAMGPAGFWIGLVSGLTAAAILLLARVVYISQQHITSAAPAAAANQVS